MMSVKFSPNALEEFWYLAAREKIIFKNLRKVIIDTQRNGIAGIGHPEALKGDLAGWYSKHVDDGNRMVFRIDEAMQTVEIAECYSHYSSIKQ